MAPTQERTPTGEALRIVSTLETAESLLRSAAALRSEGLEFAALAAENGADALVLALGGSSVARLRAAVILLAGITDEDIPHIRILGSLSDTLRRIEDGEV